MIIVVTKIVGRLKVEERELIFILVGPDDEKRIKKISPKKTWFP